MSTLEGLLNTVEYTQDISTLDLKCRYHIAKELK